MVTAAQPSQASGQRKAVIPWFIAMFASFAVLVGIFEYGDISNPWAANGLMLVPLLLLAKAGLNASHNASLRGPRGTPAKRYLTRMVVVSVLYIGSLLIASLVIEKGDPVTPITIAIAIVPGLAVAGYFYAIGRFIIEQTDEFMRMLMVRQTLVGTAFALSLAAIWGFLENFGQVPHIDAFWWPTAFFFGLGLGGLVNKMTHGTFGDGGGC